MSQKSLTVGDIMDTINYLEQIKSTANEAEKAKLDNRIGKLKEMDARS